MPRALPWFLRFIEAARPSRVEAIAAARNSLLVHTHAGYAPLIEGADAGQWVSDDGLMMTFESEATFEGAAYALDLRRRHGVHMDILDGNEARQMEPALSTKVIKAVSLPDVHRTIDPLRLCLALAAGLRAPRRRDRERRGARLRDRQREGRPRSPPTAVRCDGRASWCSPPACGRGRSPGPARHVGAARGRARLSRDVRQSGLRRCSAPWSRPIATSRSPTCIEGIRATGVAEFAAPDAPPDMRQCADMVQRHAKELVPGPEGRARLEMDGPAAVASGFQAGDRPLAAPSNVFFAFGHDHLGLTMAGITGKLVAELATGKPTTVDLAPFRPDRF